MKRSFAGTIERSGVEKGRIHDLRHTCGSWIYNNGGGLEMVKETLGHKDPRSTMRYAHVNDNFLRSISATLRRH